MQCCFLAEKGSPPRMRGKHCDAVSCVDTLGITPADAGKTSALRALLASEEDHPRGCGENEGGEMNILLPIWITPADAGKTS